MQDLSPKQLDFIQNSDARINILQGAVRSGKTYVSLWRWLKELTYGPDGEYAMLSRTYDAFKRNVLPQMIRMIGADIQYYAGKREVSLWGKQVFIIGADDERAEAKIRGATFKGAYVDEASILPEGVFRMLISRCAMGGSRIIATTNPDSPYHWLYRDYLQNNSDVKQWHFTLDDNPRLSQDEKDYLKRQYKGLWYQRFIEGRWVQAEGAIYDTFDPDLHCIDFATPVAQYYICGVDYGTTNPCAFILIGVNRNKFPNIWVDNEYYYDSKVHQRQKTNTEYAEDLKKFIQDKYVKAIYVDPSAASFKQELSKQGVSGLYDAENEVIDGIRYVNNLLNNGTLKIARHCTNLIAEMQSYVWNSKSALRGKEEPLKERDHACVVGSTKVMTAEGEISIEDLLRLWSGKLWNANLIHEVIGIDEFWNVSMTRQDAEIFELELVDGKTLRATGDHLIFTKIGYKMLQELTQSDMVLTCNYEDETTNPAFVQVEGVKKVNNEDVYCLATKNGNFIANGIVVKNCDALRYGLFTHFFNKETGGMTAQDIERNFREAVGGGMELPAPFQKPGDDFGGMPVYFR